MADLIKDFEKIEHDALQNGSFMLQLRRDSWPDGIIVDELIVPLARAARVILLPGYSPDWARAARMPPDWASALNKCVQESGGREEFFPAQASIPALRQFWIQGSFVERGIQHSSGMRVFRPAIPTIGLDASSLAEVPFKSFATTFIGFVKNLEKGSKHFKASVQRVRRLVDDGSDLIFVLYQDPSTLHFVGAPSALSEAISVLRLELKKTPPS